jgi:hypothetical protein
MLPHTPGNIPTSATLPRIVRAERNGREVISARRVFLIAIIENLATSTLLRSEKPDWQSFARKSILMFERQVRSKSDTAARVTFCPSLH